MTIASPATDLVRVRLNHGQIERLDEFAAKIGVEIKRHVSRAAFVRALVTLGLTWAIAPEIVDAIKADTVRRGYPAGRPRTRRAR